MGWEIQDIIPFGNNVVFRYLFGWLVPPKVSLLKLTQGKTLKRLYETKHMIQDMLVPIADLKASIELFHREVSIYPIWLCPFKLPAHPGMLKPHTNKEEMFVDVGVYGVPKNERFDAERTTRKVEEFVRNINGFQMMYADSYMTREEFRLMFDHTLYDKVRDKLGCRGNFPEIYDKVNKKARSGPVKAFKKTIEKKLKKKHHPLFLGNHLFSTSCLFTNMPQNFVAQKHFSCCLLVNLSEEIVVQRALFSGFLAPLTMLLPC